MNHIPEDSIESSSQSSPGRSQQSKTLTIENQDSAFKSLHGHKSNVIEVGQLGNVVDERE